MKKLYIIILLFFFFTCFIPSLFRTKLRYGALLQRIAQQSAKAIDPMNKLSIRHDQKESQHHSQVGDNQSAGKCCLPEGHQQKSG